MLLFFGGSFDPIHIGHLILARDVREFFSYQKVVFIPAYISPLKVRKGHSAPPEDRLNMLLLAIRGVKYFSIEPYELERKDVSYTLYTVKYLRAKYGLKKVHWLMGDDTFLQFHKWFKWKELLNYLLPVVVLRNSSPDTVVEYATKVLGLEGEDFRLYTSRRIEISSTEIRNRLKEGKDIRYMVPEEVEAYIREKNLYR